MANLDKTGGVGIFYYSNVSVSDSNCIVKFVPNKETISTAATGTWLKARSRIIEFYGDISNMYFTKFMFSQTTALSRINIGPADKDGKLAKAEEGQIMGTWKNLIHMTHCFRHKTTIKKQHMKFPKMVYSGGNFYKSSLEEIKTNYQNVVVMKNDYELCVNLSSVEFEGGLKNLVIGSSAFSGCSNLTDFQYDLPRLLAGPGMFKGCKLNKESVERILKSLPDVTKIKELSQDQDITKGVTVKEIINGVTKEVTHPYWGIVKDGNTEKNVEHENTATKNPPNEDTTQVLGKVYKYNSNKYIRIHIKYCRRRPQPESSIPNETQVIDWYWGSHNIQNYELGVLTIGMAEGVKTKVKNAIEYAEGRGWTLEYE